MDQAREPLRATTMMGFSDPEGTIVTRCINIKETRNKYRHLISIQRGYKGLCLYLVFLGWYIYIIAQQHRATQVGDVNSALQISLDKQKSDLVTTDSASLYTFMSKKIVPLLLSSEWSNTTSGGKHISGHTTNDYYQVVGGVVLTAQKSKVKKDCFHGFECYDEEILRDPYYNISLPGKAGEFHVPYDDHYQGYSLVVPSSVDAKTISSLLTAYESLFGQSTRKISITAVLFNPSGAQTLTFLDFACSISVHNNIKFTVSVKTIPYHWYLPGSRLSEMTSQILFLLFTIKFFIVPLLSYQFLKPKRPSEETRETDQQWVAQIEKWVGTWHFLPQTGGQPILSTPTIIYSLLFSSGVLWLYLGYMYSQLGDFAHSQWLFEDVAKPSADITDLFTASLHAMHKRILPLSLGVDGITDLSQWYFSVHVLILAVVIWRIQQYLIFQRHLSMVADTFQGIYDDLLHMGLVLVLVCFIFGVINSLAIGNYDEAFQSIFGSFFTMLEVTFGLYKPAADTPFVQSLVKYSPHVLRAEATVNWLPLLINIAFKTLVIMLLFKLLMGVVMEGYKKHRPKGKIASVRENMATLLVEFKLWVLSFTPGNRYVPFIHVALAVAHYQRHLDPKDPSYEWKKQYLGLDSSNTILHALNWILDEKNTRRTEKMKQLVDSNNLKRCDEKQLHYVLEEFGENRQRARVAFAEALVKKRQVKDTKDKEKKTRKDELASVQEQLDKMQQEWHGEMDSVRFLNSEARASFLLFVKDTFEMFDFLRIGTIDIRHMPFALQMLGFKMGGKGDTKVAALLHKHDANGDGNFSLVELETLVFDNALIGRFRPPPEITKGLKQKSVFDKQKGFVDDKDDEDDAIIQEELTTSQALA